MINRLLTLLIMMGLVGCGSSGRDHPLPTVEGTTTKLSGGMWFDGQEFVSKTFYSVAGTLTEAARARVDSVLDLSGKFVVPPYADAHVHNLNEDGSIDEDIKNDLLDGMFYAMEQDPAIELSPGVRSRVNTPSSVDVAYTQGLVTPSWGVMADMKKTGFTDGHLDHWKLTDENAQRAADKKVVVITTTLKEAADSDGEK
jgi:hypothetical protein